MSEHDEAVRTGELGALIRQALDDRPPADLPERVMAKLALVATAVELFRLAAEAPFSALLDEEDRQAQDDQMGLSSSTEVKTTHRTTEDRRSP